MAYSGLLGVKAIDVLAYQFLELRGSSHTPDRPRLASTRPEPGTYVVLGFWTGPGSLDTENVHEHK